MAAWQRRTKANKRDRSDALSSRCMQKARSLRPLSDKLAVRGQLVAPDQPRLAERRPGPEPQRKPRAWTASQAQTARILGCETSASAKGSSPNGLNLTIRRRGTETSVRTLAF